MNFEASNAITKRLKNLDFFWKTCEHGIPKNAILDECYHLLYKQIPDLELELKNNFIENAERAGEYSAYLLDDVNEVYDLVNSQTKNKDVDASVPDELLFALRFHKKDFNQIKIDVEGLLALCSYSLKRIIDTIEEWRLENSLTDINLSPEILSKVLYLVFSKITDGIISLLTTEQKKVNQKELAIILAIIVTDIEDAEILNSKKTTDIDSKEKAKQKIKNIEVLLSRIKGLKSIDLTKETTENGKKVHTKIFPSNTLINVIKNLKATGFDYKQLEQIEFYLYPKD